MAKIPQPPKPKLPKPKKSLGQHIKDNTRKAAASSLRRNFGVLGNAIAKKYLAPPRVKTTIRVEPDLGNKKINKKRLKTEVTPDVSILESAKQVTNAVEIVTSNASRGFARVSRQVDTMGEEVTKAMNELSGVLDRMLYRKPPAPAPEAVPTGPQRVETAPAAGGGGLWPWLARLLPLAGILLGTYAMRRTSKQKEDMYNEDVQKYGKDKADELKRTRNWGITGWLNNKLDDAVEMFSGKSPAVGGKKQIGGGENIIHKMKYSADKIKFIASGTIEFKSKITEAKSSTSTAKPPSAGFFNDLGDKLIGGRGGGGYAGGGGKDGAGGGPTPNTSKPSQTPSGTPAIKGETSVDQTGRADPYKHQGGQVEIGGKKYNWGSGGAGYASMPYGDYPITPNTIGPWGTAHGALGINNNQMWDPKLGRMRNGIELHSGSSDQLITEGCMAIAGDQWPEFKTKVLSMIKEHGTAYLHMGPNGATISPEKPGPVKKEEKPADAAKTSDTKTTPEVATKFLNVDPAENKEASGVEPYEFPKAAPRKAWQGMKPVGYDGRTGEYRVDDRRNEPDPYDNDPYTVDAMDAAAYAKVPELLKDIDARDAKYFVPTPLGYAAGGRDLLDINPTNMSHQYEMIRSGEIASWDTLRPPDEPRRPTQMVVRPDNNNPTTRSPSIISQYEDTHLDHRPQQDAVPDTDFSSYMDVK